MKKAFLSLLLVVTMLITMVMPLVSHAGTQITTNYIMFDLNGGTTSASQTMFTYLFWGDDVNPFSVVFSSASGYDTAYEALFATTVKSGYKLAGFTCLYNNQTYTSLSELKNSTEAFPAAPETMVHGFKAVWEELDPNATTYSVTLKSGKGGLGSGVTLTKTRGQDLNLLTNKDYIKAQYGLYPGTGAEGYGAQRVLIEWNTAYDPTTGKGIGTAYRDVYNVDANVTLYAIWGYNIQYNADGGIFPATGNSIFLKYVCDSDNSNYNNPMTLYGNFDMPVGTLAPVKPGCRRVNMSSGAEFYGLLNADMSFFTTETTAQNLTIPPTGHKMPWSYFHCATTSTGHTAVEFYAIWEPSVTYNPNGGSGTQYSEYLEWDWDPLHYYQPYYVDSCGFSKSGTYFVGWNTQPNGTGTSYSVGQNIGGQRANSDPIVLYAQWADGSTGHTHSYSGAVTSQATCTAAGVMTYTCSCGSSYTQAIPAKGHNFVTYNTDGNATCTTDGTKTAYCANNCGTSNTVTDSGSALGHNFETYYSNGNSTCTKDGTETAICTRCSVTNTRTETGSASGHDFSILVGQYPQDDCSEDVIGVYQCTKCGDYVEKAIEGTAKNHTPFEQKFNETAPTCTVPGSYESLITCDICGATISYEIVTVPATGHTPVTVPGVEPTCTQNGKTESSYCTTCSETISVATVIPAKGHSYKAVVTAPTCTAGGYTTYTCSVCGNSYTANNTPANGHKYNAVVTAPTCTEAGYTTYTCTVCGDSYVSDNTAANGHSVATKEENRVEADCANDGSYDVVTYCTVCNTEFSRETVVIPSDDHNYVPEVKEATCTEGGYTTYTCTGCHDTYVADQVAALGHNEVVLEATAPSCTENGFTEGRYCSRCDEVFTKQETIPALGHSYNAVVTAPTCTEAGYTTYTCSNCNDSYTADEVAANGHNYTSVVTEPTCTSAGYTTYTCTVCGDSYTSDEVAAKGHAFGDWYTTTEPTEETEGEARRDCAACGAYETKVLPKLEVELPEDAPVMSTKNYNIMFTKADTIYAIRYVQGTYTTASAIKNAQGCVTLSSSKIASFTKDGVCTLTMKDGGMFSVWIKTTEGKEYIYHADLSYMEQEVTADGVTMTVHNLYGVKDFFIAPGDYNTYAEVKANYLVNVTSAKIGTDPDFTYVVKNPGMHTVYIRYQDSTRPATIIKIMLTVDEPTFNGNGLQFTVGNLKGVKVIRTAYGEYATPGDVKRADGQRSFAGSSRALKDKTEFTIQYRTNGLVTIAVVYHNGYQVMYYYDVQQKTPSFVQNGNTVTIGQLDDLNVIRYAEGIYTTSSQIKAAEGSKVLKAAAIVDGFITVTLEPGTYTFCVQYFDESYNYYTVVVDEPETEEPEEPAEPTYPGYGKQYTMTFNTNGGELPEGVSHIYGINYGENYLAATGVDMPVPTKEGYVFDGWVLNAYNYWLNIYDWNVGYYAVRTNVVFDAVWIEE